MTIVVVIIVKGFVMVVIVVTSCCRKRRVLMLRALGMRLLTRLLLLVCSLSLVSLFFLSRCGLNVDPDVQLEPGTGKFFFLHLLAIRKHYTIASYELMCWHGRR